MAEFSLLQNAARHHVGHGVHLNDVIGTRITHPELLAWQRQSNEFCRETPGRHDLIRRRRQDVLRWRTGFDARFPYTLPLEFITSDPALDERFPLRIFRLQDELELRAMRFRPTRDPRVPWRPVKDVLGHEDVRAILDWKASHLDLWLSTEPDFIGGYISLDFTRAARASLDERANERGRELSRPRDKIHKVRFDTLLFMIWYYSNLN